MNVVAINRSGVDKHLVCPRRLPQQLSTTLPNITCQNCKSVFRRPYKVILAVPDRVAAPLVRLHFGILHGHRWNPMPPKGVGIADPLSGTAKCAVLTLTVEWRHRREQRLGTDREQRGPWSLPN